MGYTIEVKGGIREANDNVLLTTPERETQPHANNQASPKMKKRMMMVPLESRPQLATHIHPTAWIIYCSGDEYTVGSYKF